MAHIATTVHGEFYIDWRGRSRRFPMSLFLAVLIALAVLGTLAATVVWVVARKSYCRHAFGRPTSGYVRCLRCTRRYRIETTPAGEWRIGKAPME